MAYKMDDTYIWRDDAASRAAHPSAHPPEGEMSVVIGGDGKPIFSTDPEVVLSFLERAGTGTIVTFIRRYLDLGGGYYVSDREDDDG